MMRTRTFSDWLEVGAATVAVAVLGVVFARALFVHGLRDVAPINAGDFLISYAGGFVRRGLVGELLFQLPWLTSMARLETAIKTLSAVAYLTAFAMLAAIVRRATGSLTSTLLVICQPFLFGFGVMTGQWIKEDALLLVGFYAVLGQLASPRPASASRWIVVNVISMLAILTHEAYGVAMLPLLILMAAARGTADSWVTSLARAAARFSPAWLALFLVVAHPGDGEVAARILSAWSARGITLPPETSPAFFGLTHTRIWRMGFDMMRSNYLDKPFFFLFWGGVIVSSAMLLTLASGLARGQNDRGPAVNGRRMGETGLVILLAGAGFGPLFLMATDFGRWIFLWLTAAAGVAFSPIRHELLAYLARVFSPFAPAVRGACLRVASLGESPRARTTCIFLLTISLLCLPLPTYEMEGCCSLRFVAGFSLLARIAHLLGVM